MRSVHLISVITIFICALDAAKDDDAWNQEDAEIKSMIDAVEKSDESDSQRNEGRREGPEGLIIVEPPKQQQFLLKKGDPWPWRKERIARTGRPKGEGGESRIIQISVLGEVRPEDGQGAREPAAWLTL